MVKDMGNGRKQILFLLVTIIVALLFFSNKPIHMDDILFLNSAENIVKDFTRPYDFTINWSGTADRAWDANKNPPLSSYILAPLVKLFPGKIIPLHIAFMIFPIIAVMAMYSIASRFVKDSILPSLFLFISPAFFVTATSLMCDLPHLAFYLSALLFYIKGFEREKGIYFVLSGVLAGLAVLTKYTAINLIFIFLLYSIVFKKRSPKAIMAILIPLVLLTLWGLHGIYFYGKPHFFTLSEQVYFFWEKANPLKEGVVNISEFFIFLSGCSLFIFFSFFSVVKEKQKSILRKWGIIGLVSTFLTMFTVSSMAERTNRFDFILIFLFIALSISFFKTAFTYYAKNKTDKNFLFLFGWFLLNCAIVMFNYTIAARFILLVLPPMGLLTIYIMEKHKIFERVGKRFVYRASALIFLITILIAHSDYYFAASYRNFSKSVPQSIRERKIWFVGHWGFQYYMKKNGFEPIDFVQEIVLTKGDVIVVPMSNTSVHSEKLNKIIKPYNVYKDKVRGFFSLTLNAGFYNHGFGPLPYAPGAKFSEIYQIYEVTKSVRISRLI